MKPDLSVKISRVRLRNPTVLCSGYLGTSAGTLLECAKNGAGAVTSKSCSLEPRKGHENPTVIHWDNIVMNAVGLSNPGVEHEIEELKIVKKEHVPLIASVFADGPESFAEVTERISEAKPDLIELNLGCPNVKACATFASRPDTAAEAVTAAKNSTKIPVYAKLSPNVSDIAGIAKACEDAGADGIAAINTVGPGMRIDVRARRFILSNKTGGVSGPGIKPIAIKCVYEISRSVEIPVIGMGGLLTGEDAAEFFMAGASAVGVGSALLFRGKDAFKKISSELSEFMKQEGYSKLDEITLRE